MATTWAHKWASIPHVQKLGSLRVSLIVLGILVALLVIIRLVLDPIATQQTRKALDQMEGFRGDFERVHVTIFGPGYDITHLKLREETKAQRVKREGGEVADDKREPMVYVRRAHLGIDWRELLHLRVAAALRIEEPKMVFTAKKTEEPSEKAAAKAPDLAEQLYNVTALKVDRIEVLGGEFLFRNPSEGKRQQELWVHSLEVVAQNLATRAKLSGGRATTLSVHGMVARSGNLDVFVSADPFASPLSFAGQMSLKGLEASELYEFIAPVAELQASQGTIDVFAEFVSKDGMVTGGVKPVLKNIEVRPTDDDGWNRLKAWFADKSVEIASDRVPDRNAVATTVPIKGKLTDPQIQLWPAVLGVIRNAFVQGLASGFQNVPPPTAEKKQGVFEQAKNALKKDEGPPKAQPITPN